MWSKSGQMYKLPNSKFKGSGDSKKSKIRRNQAKYVLWENILSSKLKELNGTRVIIFLSSSVISSENEIHQF